MYLCLDLIFKSSIYNNLCPWHIINIKFDEFRRFLFVKLFEYKIIYIR